MAASPITADLLRQALGRAFTPPPPPVTVPPMMAGVPPAGGDAPPPAPAPTQAPASAQAPTPAPDNAALDAPAPEQHTMMPTRIQKDTEALDSAQNTPSWVHQFGENHHILGPVIKVLDALGSFEVPGLMAALPGSSLGHKMQIREAKGTLSDDYTRQQQQALADQESAKAQELMHPKPKTVDNPENDTYQSLINGGMSPQDALGITKSAGKSDKAPSPVDEKLQPAEINQFNEAAKARWQVNHPKEELPPHYTLPPDATRGFADRIEKSMGSEEAALSSQRGHSDAMANARVMQALAGKREDRSETSATDKQQAALDKKNAPMQQVVDEVSDAHDLAKQPNPSNDFGLMMHFIGITKPEGIGKLRLNQNEIKLVLGLRSSMGDLEAMGQKIANGQLLTPEQRQQMLGTMDTIASAAQRRMNGGEQQPQTTPASGGGAQPQTTPASGGGKQINYVWKDGKLVTQ